MYTQREQAPRACDTLPKFASASALVRRICFRLNGELCMRGHKPLSMEERAAFFDLADASKILDGIAILRGMAQHEERARTDLLALFDLFDKETLSQEAVSGQGDEPSCTGEHAALVIE